MQINASCSLFLVPESITSSVAALGRLSPEVRPHYVRLPESFTYAVMNTHVFFFGVTRQSEAAYGRSQFQPAVIFP